MANHKRGASKRKVNKTNTSSGQSQPKQSPGTLENAFRTALRGRMCQTCKKVRQRVAHAIYQRHSNDCRIMEVIDGNGAEEDVIFCGIYQSSQVNEPMQNREIKTEQRSPSTEVLSTNDGETERICQPDTTTTSSTNDEGTNNDDNNDIAKNINAIPILEVYELCLRCLDKFIGRHYQSSNAISQTQRNLQRYKENISGGKPEETKSNHQKRNQPLVDKANASAMDSLSQQMHQRIEQRSPEEPFSARYSLRIVWKILRKVLLCPEHCGLSNFASLFWGEYLRTLLKFLSLPVETQQLFVLLLRRRWGWHLLKDIQEKYRSIITGDFAHHFQMLCYYGLMRAGSTSNTTPLNEALILLKKPDFLPLCKNFQINGKGQNISTLIGRFVELGEQRTLFGGKREQMILKNIRKIVGEFFRIEYDVLHLFTAFFTVYSPTYMDTARLYEYKFNEELSGNLIFTVLQFESDGLLFPSPSEFAHSLLGILGNVEELMNYTKAKHTEQRIIRLLNRQPPAFEEALEFANEAKQMLLDEFLLSIESQTRRSFCCGLPSYHRRFTGPWVLCRCIFTGGVEVAQKLRNYELAVELLKFLLENDVLRHFCMSSRGKWYERIALNLERHLKNLEQSVHFCRMGTADELVGRADRLILQLRLVKLLERMKQTTSQIESSFITLQSPERMEISGQTLSKGLGDGEKVNHFYIGTGGREEFNKCSVEELVLHHFITKEQFTHGIHSEGSIWHSLFRLFFTDIIFDADVQNVWLSQIQDDPLDLNFPDFYLNRRMAIDQRLKEIHSTQNLSAFSRPFYEKVKLKVATNSHISWHNFQNADQIAAFLDCCSPLMLHDLLRELCTNFKESRSGFPDLVLWNEQTAKMAVVEVKGPNDSLSAKQRLWLDFFQAHGVRAVVCHVVARNDRML